MIMINLAILGMFEFNCSMYELFYIFIIELVYDKYFFVCIAMDYLIRYLHKEVLVFFLSFIQSISFLCRAKATLASFQSSRSFAVVGVCKRPRTLGQKLPDRLSIFYWPTPLSLPIFWLPGCLALLFEIFKGVEIISTLVHFWISAPNKHFIGPYQGVLHNNFLL